MTDIATNRGGLVTPEAVRVDLPIADIGTRTLAIILDLFAMTVLLFLVTLLGGLAFGSNSGSDGLPDWVAIVIVLTLNFAVLWGLPVLAETMSGGRSLGKAVLGIRVVTVDGAPIRFRHAAIRWLLAFVDLYMTWGVAGLLSALLTKRGQRLGDLAAGTILIRDRGRSAVSQDVHRWPLPPGFGPYASTLDISGLGPADYAIIRSFLLRAHTFREDRRRAVATHLANALALRIRHTPPPGTHPEALLYTVAAMLQQRAGGIPVPSPTLPQPAADPFAPPPQGLPYSS